MIRPRLGWLPGLLLGAAALAACHLFLDPDELVSGGNDASVTADTNAPVGVDAGGLATLDGDVPSCVPGVPLGTQPIVAVGGKVGNPPACPVGYEPTGQRGYGNLDNSFTCQPGSCACGSITSPLSCGNLSLVFTSDDKCTKELRRQSAKLDFGTPNACVEVQPHSGEDYAKLVGTVEANNGQSPCPASGNPVTALDGGTIGLEVQLCRPTQAADPAACPGGNAALPPVKNAVSCYASTSQNCDPAYKQGYSLALAPDLSDTRACRCDCALDNPASCVPSGFQTSDDTNCNAAAPPTLTAACRPIADYGDKGIRVDKGSPDAAAAKCAPRALQQGGLDFKTDQRLYLCCLSECGTCQQLAVSPGGTCAAVTKACTDDPDCRDYYACADKKGCADSCGSQCADGGTPKKETADKYDAIRACLGGACAPSCKNN